MKKKYLVGYCFECAGKTKQEVLECNDPIPVIAFEVIFTLGFGAMLPRDYQCECTKCGSINTIRK